MDSASLTLRATYFWNTIHDAIGNRTLTATSSLITRQRQNFGDIRSRGFEVELDARLPRHVVTRTAYEYSNSIVSRSLEVSLLDLRVTQVPRHSVSETVAYDSRRWSGSVVGRYVGGQFEDDLNTLHLPGYFSADAILRFHLTRIVEPYLACENVFNRSYVVGRTPAPSLGSPRLLRAGLRLRLGADRATQP
jgi:outer membrane receptor protein involved in Fe transport